MKISTILDKIDEKQLFVPAFVQIPLMLRI